MASTHDAVVIGAGHNGLIAACYLARAGLDVLVVEACPVIGGMTATSAAIPSAPQHMINTCSLDYVYLNPGIVRDLELVCHGYRELESEPVNVYLREDGASVAMWKDPRRTADEIRRFSRTDAEAYLQLVWELNAGFAVAQPYLVTNPVRPDPLALVRMAKEAVRGRRHLRRVPWLFLDSVAETVESRFDHDLTRDFVAGEASTVGPVLGDGSGMGMMIFPSFHTFGARRPLGGSQALPDALARSLQASGGRIRTSAVVEEITVHGGRATGVRLEGGEEIRARTAVIASCDPRSTLGGLVPPGTFDAELDARIAHIPAYGDGWTSFKIDLALSGQLRLPRHEKWRGDGLDLRQPIHAIGTLEEAKASYAMARRAQIPANPALWAAIPTGMDPGQGPAGQDTVYISAAPMPKDPATSWDDAAKVVVSRLAAFYEGIEELEIGRWVESVTDMERRLRVSGGCLYHTDHSMFRMGPLRPAKGLSGFRTPIPGLYLGGGGSHPSAGVCGLPGRLAAREVLRRKETRKPQLVGGASAQASL